MYESSWGAILQFLAVITGVISVIISAIFFWSVRASFWWFLASLLIIFLISAAFMTLAEIADNSLQAKMMMQELLQAQEKAGEATTSLDEATQTAKFNPLAHLKNTPISNVENLDNGWRCKKCEDNNLPAAVSCRSCGEYK